MTMLISQLGLKPDALQGETVIVTGAGGGIGYERRPEGGSRFWIRLNTAAPPSS